MKIIHSIFGKEISRDVSYPVSFLITNKLGGFLSISTSKNISRYQGLYNLKTRNVLIKTIDSFSLSKQITAIKNNITNVERIYGDTKERFTFIDNSNTVVYQLENYSGTLTIPLDCREMYDFNDRGREFNIRKEKDTLIVTYNKKENKKYAAYLVIRGISEYDVLNNYSEQSYPFDKKRNSSPSKWWIFDGIKLKVNNAKTLIISVGDDLQKVKYEGDEIYSSLDKKIEINEKQKLLLINDFKEIPDDDIRVAYLNSFNAINSLSCLIDRKRGIYAGLWWFFQWWSRDEAICSKSLILSEQYLYAKDILLRQIETIFDDGRAPNIYPNEGLSSADGIGWSFKRIYDLIFFLRAKKMDHIYFNEADYSLILSKLELSIQRMTQKYKENGFFKSGYNETWMDTCGDSRNGCRIEIQALILNMYKFLAYLSDILEDSKKKEIYSNMHDAFKNHIKDFFFSGFELADGINDKVVDFTVRPNIFIAYYIAPQILTCEEWKRVFDNALPHLLIEWGYDKCGIASIDKNHKQFIDEYSGENNISYHFGDVWYYINNITALCLFRLDSSRYKETIQKLIHTSTEEILWNGIIGYHAEVSSAKEFRSEAALAQAWSSSTYVELINEIYGK